MDEYLPFSGVIDTESEEYSIETEINDLVRQPLIDILVALMLINDIFLFLRNEL